MPKTTAPIFGFIGDLHFNARFDDEQDEGFLYGYAVERRKNLEQSVRRTVAETLGRDYEVLDVRFSQGSVEIMVLLGVGGTFYVTISQYDDFIKGINRLAAQLKRLFQAFFEGAVHGPPSADISVTGSWRPSPILIEAHRQLMTPSRLDTNLLLLSYLILSHASLLGLLIWLVARHLK